MQWFISLGMHIWEVQKIGWTSTTIPVHISLIGKFRRETNGKRGLLDPFNGVPLLTLSHVKNCALKFIICTFQLVSGCRFTATQDQAQRMTEMFGEKWLSQIGFFLWVQKECRCLTCELLVKPKVWQKWLRFMAGRCLESCKSQFFDPTKSPATDAPKVQKPTRASVRSDLSQEFGQRWYFIYCYTLCVLCIYDYIILYMHGISMNMLYVF